MADAPLTELEQKLRELDAVNAIGKALTSSLDLHRVLVTVMVRVSGLLHPSQYTLLLADEKTGELVFEVVVGEGAAALQGLRLKPGEGIAGWAATKQEALLVTDVAMDPRFAARFDEVSQVTTKSILAVPLVARGRTLGVIELINGLRDRPFSEDDLRMTTMLAEFAAIGIDNARHYAKVEELTIVDEHTRLYNARYLKRTLESEVERSRRFSHPLSVVFFDLDRFKQLNDTHGHDCGSAALAEVGELLLTTLRTTDVAIRYGGDEFVLLLPETPKTAAVDVTRRLHALLGRHEFLASRGLSVHLTGSFGVASFPDDGTTADEILRAADKAMYTVKEATRDGIAAATWGLV